MEGAFHKILLTNHFCCMESSLINKSPDSHNLLAYKKAKLVYKLNHWFISNFPLACKRTFEQMDQGARSGKQNIEEGINNYATSKASGIHLINVAAGSLKELREDYEDFLLINNHEQWGLKDDKFKAAQKLGKEKYEDIDYFIKLFEERKEKPEVIANIMIVLLKQTIYLQDALLKSLEKDLLQNGGFRENIYKYRKGIKG